MALHIKRGAGEPSELLAISEIYFDLTNKDFYVGDEVANYRVNDAVMLRWLNNQAIQAKNFAGSFVDVFKVNTSNQLENLLKTKLTGGLKSPFTQVVIVDSGGLGDYTSIQDASDTITDADPVTKPYTILVVSPGGYDPAGYTLKNGVNVIALDPKNTKILGQVTDNNVECHCYLKITIESASGHGLYTQNANTVVDVDGAVSSASSNGIRNANGTININGDVSSPSGTGIEFYNGILNINGRVSSGGGCGIYMTGGVLTLNGNIINTWDNASAQGIELTGGTFIQHNGTIYITNADAKAIYADSAKNVKLMNVWSNRDLHSNITNLISGGFTYDSDVPSS